MKKYLVIMAAVAAALLAVSCNKEQNTPDEPQQTVAGEQITITASIPAELSKVGLAYTGSALHPTWAAGDKIRVADHSDASNYQDFTLTGGEGTQNGTFSGTAVSATSYDITILNATSWPGNVLAQTQAEDESTAHLGYTVALTGVNTYEDIAFTSAWATSKGGTIAQSGALHLSATLPSGVAAKVNKVTMIADQKIFGSTGTMVINITTPKDNGTANTIDVYASVPASGVSIPSGTLLLFQFGTTDGEHSVYTRYYKTDADITLAGGQLSKITLDHTKAGKFFEGDGTATHPYLIADKNQMASMHAIMIAGETTYFNLVDDINLSGVSWTPLNSASPYTKKVNFNGGNHKISNFAIDDSEMKYASFTGVLCGSFNNVIFENATISCGGQKGGVVAGILGQDGAPASCSNVSITNSSVTSTTMSAVFAAQANVIGTLSNCTISSSSVSGGARVGALIGSLVDYDEISDCSAEDVTVTSTDYYAGGLIGQSNGTGVLTRCHSTGSVTANHASYARSGGLIGYLIKGSVDNSYSTCSVTVKGQYGASLVGQIKNATITKCYATGTVTSSNHFAGGILGLVESSGSATIEKSYFNGSIILPTGSSGKAQAGGIIAYMDATTSATISNCYTSGAWAGRRWFGGIVGGLKDSATSLSVTNCYTPYGAVVGAQSIATASVTCTGCIGWWASGTLKATGNDVTATNCYIGQEGTLSAKATELGWSDSIWNLSGDVPTLK